MSALILTGLAWAIEGLFGWPNGLYKRIRHPVVWIGFVISSLDRFLNNDKCSDAVRYGCGALATVMTIGAVTSTAVLITNLLPNSWTGFLIEALIASSLISSRSLYEHVAAVFAPLQSGDVEGARNSVGKIVGRDPNALDESGLARASLESLAENASDGVIAPVFWGSVFGLPGLAAYKAVNTLDSMIGHRNETYASFGGFAARLDDLANLIPSRLTGVLIAVASLRGQSFRVMFRDASQHRSPNAGWPEAAMAGALGVRLSGPRFYGAEVHHEPWLNQAGGVAGAGDLKRGLDLYVRALILAGLILVVMALGVDHVS